MKVLNFSVLEILPALRNKSKTQTIRKAWKPDYCAILSAMAGNKEAEKQIMESKPARFKVGEKVKIMWKQRSKGRWFCSVCGNPITVQTRKPCNCSEDPQTVFYKSIGIVEITEVFKIEMDLNEIGKYDSEVSDWIRPLSKYGIGLIVSKDGFKSIKDMFKWFHDKYDLSNAKQFWVYRWKWLP